MSVHGFRYLMFNSKNVGPSIEAGYGPYDSLQEAIQTINGIFRDDPSAEAYSTTGYEPPLGLKFGVLPANTNTFIEYQYKHNTNNLGFSYNNTAEGGASNPGIVVIGTGGSGTITNVVKGKSTDSLPSTLVTGTIAYIPMAEAPTILNSNGIDGLMSASDKAKLDLIIEVLENGFYTSDASFETQGGSLEDKVNRIIAILGPLYDNDDTDGINDAHFEIQ